MNYARLGLIACLFFLLVPRGSRPVTLDRRASLVPTALS